LLARQNDGILPPFPIWDDVQTFDGKPWRGIIDVVSGGFPCQDISSAGKGAGIDGERSGMWSHMARIIGEVRPQYAYIENSPMLITRGLERVLADLAQMGFNAEWGVLSAADVGANHIRERIWIVAKDTQQHRFFSHTEHNWDGWGQQQSKSVEKKNFSNSNLPQQQRRSISSRVHTENAYFGNPRWWQTEPDMGRVANGLANGVDRLKAIGNGQVPLCAATAWELLTERLNERDRPQ
jgi:DNA (cytosine-5)-methyltransferase 1